MSRLILFLLYLYKTVLLLLSSFMIIIYHYWYIYISNINIRLIRCIHPIFYVLPSLKPPACSAQVTSMLPKALAPPRTPCPRRHRPQHRCRYRRRRFAPFGVDMSEFFWVIFQDMDYIFDYFLMINSRALFVRLDFYACQQRRRV